MSPDDELRHNTIVLNGMELLHVAGIKTTNDRRLYVGPDRIHNALAYEIVACGEVCCAADVHVFKHPSAAGIGVVASEHAGGCPSSGHRDVAQHQIRHWDQRLCRAR